MGEYKCVRVNHHKDIGRTIDEWQRRGQHLHIYQAAGQITAFAHFLLFERRSELKELHPQGNAIDRSEYPFAAHFGLWRFDR